MRRTTGRARAAALVLAAAAASGCGGGGEKDDVNDYIREANGVQREAGPDLRRANRAYRAFSQGKIEDAKALLETRRAEQALRDARADLARLEPPPAARELHSRLLRVFDLNADFAQETTLLAAYVPAAAEVLAPLQPITARLQRRLRAAGQPRAQAAALRGYRQAVNRQLTRLRRLDPPPILAETDQTQKNRLQAAGLLAARLEDAVLDRDARRVARLLLRFRRIGAGQTSGLSEAELTAYNARYRRITDAAIALERERQRLVREVG